MTAALSLMDLEPPIQGVGKIVRLVQSKLARQAEGPSKCIGFQGTEKHPLLPSLVTAALRLQEELVDPGP